MLDNYGVSKNNIGFILDATYTWVISLILLVCMCYRPQRGEPRSRQEADELFGSRSSEESRIFKATVTVLLFFFNLLHWGMFVSFSQVSDEILDQGFELKNSKMKRNASNYFFLREIENTFSDVFRHTHSAMFTMTSVLFQKC